MFLVIVESPLDEGWEGRDVVLYQVAGRKSNYSAAGSKMRDHRWVVESFQAAKQLQLALAKIDKVKATIREQ